MLAPFIQTQEVDRQGEMKSNFLAQNYARFSLILSFLTFNRSRPSAAYRYDGYASDTAAFDVDTFIDEVDYRRPLHVQTPIRFVFNQYTYAVQT